MQARQDFISDNTVFQVAAKEVSIAFHAKHHQNKKENGH